MTGLAGALARVVTGPGRLEYKWRVLAVVSLANFTSTLDASVVSLSLPELRSALDISAGDSLWVVTAYLLTSVGLLLAVGRLSDAFGHKRWFIAGLVLFNLGLGLTAAGQDLAQVIIFRVLSAIGGAMLLSSGVALVTSAFPGSERGRAMGLLGIMVSAGLAVGPLTVGPVLDHLGWRAAFYLRVPAGVASIALAWPLLRESRAEGGRFRFDALGAFAIFASLVSLVLTAGRAASWGLTSARFLGLVALGVAMLALFVRAERRAAQPLFDLALFRSRVYASATASMLLYFLAVAGPYYLFPFYLIQGRGYSSTASGLLFALYPVTMMLLSPVAGLATDRFGSRLPAVAGLLITVASLVAIARLGEGTPVAMVAMALVLTGVGAGLAEPANNSAVMGAALRGRLSVASASLAVSRQMGLALGIAVASALFVSRQGAYEATHSAEGALVQAFQDSVLAMVVVAAAATVIAALRGRG